MLYLVTWEINVDARTPREAAEKAQAMQRDPDTTATVFLVIGPKLSDQQVTVDLSEDDEGVDRRID